MANGSIRPRRTRRRRKKSRSARVEGRQMKRFTVMAVAVLLAARVLGVELQWQDDYDKALAAAKTGNKILMVDVYTDWCGWCKKLDRDVYANADVKAKLAKDFVALKINPEKSKKNMEL